MTIWSVQEVQKYQSKKLTLMDMRKNICSRSLQIFTVEIYNLYWVFQNKVQYTNNSLKVKKKIRVADSCYVWQNQYNEKKKKKEQYEKKKCFGNYKSHAHTRAQYYYYCFH